MVLSCPNGGGERSEIGNSNGGVLVSTSIIIQLWLSCGESKRWSVSTQYSCFLVLQPHSLLDVCSAALPAYQDALWPASFHGGGRVWYFARHVLVVMGDRSHPHYPSRCVQPHIIATVSRASAASFVWMNGSARWTAASRPPTTQPTFH